jgi:hypothetical protein
MFYSLNRVSKVFTYNLVLCLFGSASLNRARFYRFLFGFSRFLFQTHVRNIFLFLLLFMKMFRCVISKYCVLMPGSGTGSFTLQEKHTHKLNWSLRKVKKLSSKIFIFMKLFNQNLLQKAFLRLQLSLWTLI